ncbi:hypothetical protein IIB51_00800 [Patescibacteria group bacterium]|nr:hypothetical protein [Patescibacteria group bacterium]
MKKIGIVAFAFGGPGTTEPNLIIAEFSSEDARKSGCGVYTEYDVWVDSDIIVEYIKKGQKSPPSTLQIARGAIRWAEKYEINELRIVAAKPRLKRAMRDVKKAIQDAQVSINVCACQEIQELSEDIWYSPSSKQNKTYSLLSWKIAEVVLERLPFFIYERIHN